MYHLKSWLLIVLCVSVTFVQSEKLPKKLLSAALLWDQCNDYKNKVSSGEINFLSYNTWGLPVHLYGHDQDRRFELMGDSITALHADIIGLQETFHPTLRNKLLSDLTDQYYTYSDYRCARSIIPGIEMDCYGGLMTFSVFPIIEEIFYPFPTDDTYSLIERAGGKGFLASYIQHGQRIILVINTHLYAGNNVKAEKNRLKQIKYMNTLLKTELFHKADEIIMLGDFNIHHPNVACSVVYDFITDEMGFLDSKPHIDTEDFTYSASNNYTPGKEKGSKLDYVFLQQSQSGTILAQSRILDSALPLSDHFGWQVKWHM